MTNDLHILLVHGNPTARQLVHDVLQETGYSRISTASCGLSAVKVLRTHPIDLLITDIDLSELDGWRLARLVRSGIFKCEGAIPIIVVAKTWCERIAETTAREFGINELIALEHRHLLPQAITASLQPQTEVFRNPKVLMVEDHADTAQVARRVLRQRFDVEVATDGLSGLEAWKARRHDLVLLDIMLPGMSGPEVLQEILAIDRNQPVVVMTAYSTMDLAEELMLKGAADFIAKPFRADQLRRVCELAARREDYLVSNAQFAARVESLQASTEAFRKVSESHQRLLDNLSTVVLEIDHQGLLQFINQAWTRLTGFTPGESLYQSLSSYLPQDGEGGRHYFQDRLNYLLSGKVRDCQFELRLINRQGQVLWVECRLDILPSEKDGQAIFGCLDNISERKKAQRQLEYLAMHDHLTGLYNRHYFETALRQMAASTSRGAGTHALMYLDLDHFKVVNDTFGHYTGDAMLREISSLLLSRVRKSDCLCRIGGDEYGLLVHNTDSEQARQVAEDFRMLIQSFQSLIGNQQVGISCSIGISEIDGLAGSPEEYLKRADIALYVAKRRGRNRVHFYDPEDKESEELRNSLNWTRRLRQAIEDDQLLLHFQPVLHIASGEIVHYEALVRLNLPGRGLVMPGEFIPFLEMAGEMAMLDHAVLRRTLHVLKEHSGLHRVAINLSAQAFNHEGFNSVVEELLEEVGVAPQRVIFELTESASMSNIPATQRMIKRLQEIGCEFAVDDFGTGFSTFGFLKQFPADFIKVDGSFIAQLENNLVDQALVRAITQVARALGKQTVAEFVENEVVLNLIREIGIDYAQGYHIGRPLPIEQLNIAKNN